MWRKVGGRTRVIVVENRMENKDKIGRSKREVWR